MSDGKEPVGRAKGGLAAAKSMTPEKLRERAKAGAEARWARRHESSEVIEAIDDRAPKASHTGQVKIGDLTIPCAVLSDGRRVLSQRGIMSAMGRKYGGKDFRPQEDAEESGGGRLPFFLAASSLKPFINNDLAVVVSQPIPYRHGKGGGTAMGLVATALPDICDVWLRARAAGALNKSQLVVAQRAEVLMRGLAHVGIVALVDEATGYQEIRDRLALQAFLEQFLRKELAAWVKVFPDEFFFQIFRLKGWTWKGTSRRPGVVSHYINDLIYDRLGPGVLEELQRKNPSDGHGRRKARHTQWLTEDIGHPALAQHMYATIGAMRGHTNWHSFLSFFKRAYPKVGENLALALDDPNAPR